MEKIDSLNQVAEFHRTFNAPILENPQLCKVLFEIDSKIGFLEAFFRILEYQFLY